jgi:hypothetical protein
MREETISSSDTDIGEILRRGFESCKEPDDYVRVARVLILREQVENMRLNKLLQQIGETAALRNVMSE